MNKIEIKNNTIEYSDIDENIEIKTSKALVTTFKITFKSSADIEIYFDSDEETKLSIEYDISKNVDVNIFEFRKGFKTKVQYKYNLKDNARLYLYRLNMGEFVRELDFVSLKGKNSSIEFNLRTLNQNEEKYDIYISHENKDTKSIVDNIGIAFKEGIIFNVTGEVEKGNKNSYLDQNNQIVTFVPSKCQINPNLLVEEFDTNANHNALIGTLDQDAIFYLMSRGIKEEEAIKLLCQGLILNNLKDIFDKEKIIKIINEYWG